MQYDIEIKRGRRRSLSISVSHNNKITVRCPLNFSDEKCFGFLNEKKDWIDKVICANNSVSEENSDILNHKKIYVAGKKLPLVISDRNEITQSAVYVKSLKNIKRVFVSRFSEEFIEKAKCISEKSPLTASEFSFRTYRSHWGCCNAKKSIVFNYLLFMLPENLQEYVIIHELCHTVYLNHSLKFWQLVAEFAPDYRYSRKQLKKFDFITKLY